MFLRSLCTALLVLLPGLLLADTVDYQLRTARGMAIYKEHTFASDKTAELFEYLEHREFPSVTYVTTMKHARITVPVRRAEVYFLPYPGKGEVTPFQALAMIDLAQERFPQYEPQIRPLRVAWVREGRRDPKVIDQQIDARQSNRTVGESFIHWLQGLMPPRPFTPSPSPLEPPKGKESSPKISAKPNSPEQPTAQPATDDTVNEPSTIKELYQNAIQFNPQADQ